MKFRMIYALLFIMLFSTSGGIIPSGTALAAMSGSGKVGNPYIVMTADDLSSMRDNLTAHYKLGADIDLTGYGNAKGWQPIGSGVAPFKGSLDGDGHLIRGLSMNRPETGNAGLFLKATSATIKNVGLVDVNIIAGNTAGALVGVNNTTTITNSYATGKVRGGDETGGLVGRLASGSITDSYARVETDGQKSVGGLVGAVTDGTISTSYAAGLVRGTDMTVGGLIGAVSDGWSGLVNSYWDMDTTGQTTSASGGIGLSTDNMKKVASFVGFDFDVSWQIEEGAGYPKLTVFGGSEGDGDSSGDPPPKSFDVSVTYYIGEQDSVADLEADQFLKASACVTNNQETAEDVILIVALYNEGGAMVNISFASTTVGPNATELPHAGFLLPAHVAGHSVRSFVWHGEDLEASNMVPLSSVKKVPNNTSDDENASN